MIKFTKYFLLIALFSVSFEIGIFVIYFNELGYDMLSISSFQVTLFISIFLLEIPVGFLADKIGRKKSLIIGLVLKIITFLIHGYFPGNYYVVILSFIIYALAISFISGTLHSLIYESIRAEGEDKIYNRLSVLMEAIGSLSLGISIFIGPLIVKWFDWGYVYLCNSLVSFLAILLICMVFSNQTNLEQQKTKPLAKGAFKSGFNICSKVFPYSIIHASMTPIFVYSQLLFFSYGLSLTMSATLISLLEIISSMFLLFFASKVIDININTYVILFLVLNLLFIYDSSYISFVLILVMNLITSYIIAYQRVIINQSNDNDSIRATMFSFVSSMDTLIISVGYLYYGLISNYTSNNLTIMLSLSIFPLISIIIIYASRGRKKLDVI